MPVQMQLSAEQPLEASEGQSTLKPVVHLCCLTAHPHMLKDQHGLALPGARAIELNNAAIKTE